MSRPLREIKQLSRRKRKPHSRGRPQTAVATKAKYTNWFTPLLWNDIEMAANRVGHEMQPSQIVHDLKRRHPQRFAKLTQQVIGRWIDRSGTIPRWSEDTL